MLSLCAAVAVLVLGVSFDTAWRFDAGRAADIAHAVLVLHMQRTSIMSNPFAGAALVYQRRPGDTATPLQNGGCSVSSPYQSHIKLVLLRISVTASKINNVTCDDIGLSLALQWFRLNRAHIGQHSP